MKTTNAKASGLQTPAAQAGTTKPEKTARKGSTQRVKKFSPFVEQPQPEVNVQSTQDDVPDIEYMPPKPKGENGHLTANQRQVLTEHRPS